VPEPTCPKHEDYKPILVAIATGDTMVYDPVEVDEARRHAADCAFCRRELEAYKATVAALTPPPIPNEDELVAEIAENVRRNVLAKLDTWERRRRLLRWAGAFAAAAALAVLAVLLWPKPTTPDPSAHKGKPRVPGTGKPAPSPEQPEAKQKQVVPTPEPKQKELTQPERNAILATVWQMQHRAERQIRKEPSESAFALARQAATKARELIEAAPGTQEARRARYYRSRCLVMAGERTQANVAFEAYVEAVAAAEGPEAACKVLLEEGHRESQARNYSVALNRFRIALAYVKKGELAGKAYLGIGNCYAASHMSAQAEQAFRQALALGLPEREAALCYRHLIGRGLAHRRHQQVGDDMQSALASIRNSRHRATIEAQRGLVLERTEGPMAAAGHYRKVIAKYPKDDTAFAQARLKLLMARLEADLLAPMPGEPGGPRK
jgi:tetratricopeptide (TPR) repeat protein